MIVKRLIKLLLETNAGLAGIFGQAFPLQNIKVRQLGGRPQSMSIIGPAVSHRAECFGTLFNYFPDTLANNHSEKLQIGTD